MSEYNGIRYTSSLNKHQRTNTHTHTHSHAQTQNKWYRGYGATAARLTPDQKVGNSNLSGLTLLNKYFRQSVMNDNQNHTRFAQMSNPNMSGLEHFLSYVQYNYTYMCMYIYIYIYMDGIARISFYQKNSRRGVEQRDHHI
jgi:hypothetical protein